MTTEEALDWLEGRREHYQLDDNDNCQSLAEALSMAIEALKQKPFKPMVEIDLYSVIRQKYIEREVLDKIRAEIEKTYMNITYQENKDRKATWGLRKALQIIDKYKIESEEE